MHNFSTESCGMIYISVVDSINSVHRPPQSYWQNDSKPWTKKQKFSGYNAKWRSTQIIIKMAEIRLAVCANSKYYNCNPPTFFWISTTKWHGAPHKTPTKQRKVKVALHLKWLECALFALGISIEWPILCHLYLLSINRNETKSFKKCAASRTISSDRIQWLSESRAWI